MTNMTERDKIHTGTLWDVKYISSKGVTQWMYVFADSLSHAAQKLERALPDAKVTGVGETINRSVLV